MKVGVHVVGVAACEILHCFHEDFRCHFDFFDEEALLHHVAGQAAAVLGHFILVKRQQAQQVVNRFQIAAPAQKVALQ